MKQYIANWKLLRREYKEIQHVISASIDLFHITSRCVIQLVNYSNGVFFNTFKLEFTTVIFIHYNPRLVVDEDNLKGKGHIKENSDILLALFHFRFEAWCDD